MYQENDVLKHDNIRMQMLLAEVKRIRDVRPIQDMEIPTSTDEYSVVAEENTSLCNQMERV